MPRIHAVLVLMLLGAAVSCSPGAEEPLGPSLGKSVAGVSVTSALPAEAPRETTLDVQILGSGFDNGSRASFEIGGVVDARVRVNSTRFVKSTQLTANLTIAADAVAAKYDVVVQTASGKKGIGTERFSVQAMNVLPTLGGGQGNVGATNPEADMTGFATNAQSQQRPVIWPRSGGIIALPLPAGRTQGIGKAINSQRVVVGDAGTPTRWTPDGAGAWSVSSLELLVPADGGSVQDINSAGIAVGAMFFIATGQPQRAVRWEGSGRATLLPALPGGVAYGQAFGINDQGIVVGWSDDGAGGQLPVAWLSDGTPVVLPVLGGYDNGRGLAINEGGVIVGRLMIIGQQAEVAVRWRPNPNVTNGWLPPEVLGPGRSHAINDTGLMAGHTPVGSNKTQTPAYWGDGTIGTRLLPVGGNGWSGTVRGISMPGVGTGVRLVGTTYSSGGKQLAVWWPAP